MALATTDLGPKCMLKDLHASSLRTLLVDGVRSLQEPSRTTLAFLFILWKDFFCEFLPQVLAYLVRDKLVDAILLRASAFLFSLRDTCLMENSLKLLRPAINASYSVSLFVASNLNLMAYVNSTPSGLVSISPDPETSIQDHPFVERVQGSGISSGSVMGTSGDSSSDRSTIKSASIYPLMDALGLYWMSYPSSSNFHFSILPLISEFNNSCFIG
ncbi:hypothetical protein Tco_1446416 [Tanacetum coccineum]